MRSHAFEIIVAACILLILILGVYHLLTGRRGTWSKDKWTALGIDIHSHRPYAPLNNNNNNNITNKRISKGEMECRRTLVSIFGVPFESARPDFLRNNVTGGVHNLELDCYNEKMRLAVEYNGVQHYKYIPYFHKNKESFLNQKYRDDMKKRICREHGVILIDVPYTVKHANISSYIVKALRKYGYNV